MNPLGRGREQGEIRGVTEGLKFYGMFWNAEAVKTCSKAELVMQHILVLCFDSFSVSLV